MSTRLFVVALLFLSAGVPAVAQEESLRYRTGRIRVGDRVLGSPTSNGDGEPCTVTGIRDARGWRPGYDGDILMKCDSGVEYTLPATGDHVKQIASSAPPATPASRPALVTSASPAPTAPPAALPTAAAPRPNPPAPTAGNAFGTRDPRPCPRVTARPPATEAAQLAACSREAQSGKYTEYLVEAAQVSSMTGSTYDPRVQTGFADMDTTVAPVAIRGSIVVWSCRPVDGPGVMAKYSNVGHNCDRSVEHEATGYCYRLRTGPWSCAMNDTTHPNADVQTNLPPPR